MTHEVKINYMRIAAGVCGFGCSNQQLDLLVSVYEQVIKKQGRTDLGDLLGIEADVKKRADVKTKRELLDKVSKKR